ncbi:Leucine-rich repeat protein kinase family protein [Rhynchospora pubera]|uniref:Leucine-rich repeat protein kinase family protein n=1 Tax=Rhynchospora pubera TaxID=906938 RepID=A0AAV8EP32_9POAL|nr:Leucine-rich repeat protein kinase family protein [Rhynchospora pubera]
METEAIGRSKYRNSEQKEGHRDRRGRFNFVSIDCGANSSFVDTDTKLTYLPDDKFIDTGVNYEIAFNTPVNGLSKQFLTVRSFPNGTRNCYTFRSLSAGSKYLVRASFMYGNYDNLNMPPIFDIHLGVNYWLTVNTSIEFDDLFTEIITVADSDYLQVCLINKDLGNPFISALELRPLKKSIYQEANSAQSLVTGIRWNLGGSNDLRYPDDPYDRIWKNFTFGTSTDISTTSAVQPDSYSATPSLVMQTASTSSSTERTLSFSWSYDNQSSVCLVILHIFEIQDIPRTDFREFDILQDGDTTSKSSFNPSKLDTEPFVYTDTGDTKYNVSLQATSKSTLPPLLNAIEVYLIRPTYGIPTNGGDGKCDYSCLILCTL